MFCQLHGCERVECDGCMFCYALEAGKQKKEESDEEE